MAVNKVPRQRPLEQNPSVRARNFEEVSFAFTPATAQLEASRCLQCAKPLCEQGCPVGVKIPDFIALVKQGKYAEACSVIKQTSNLPAVCGRVCPQESQCEAKCVRGRIDEPVAIGNLERFAADYARINDLDVIPEKGALRGKVAVVGSGPSGLTAAADCAIAGLDVTVYEAFHKAGGVLTYGIPEFRLPKSIVQHEIDKLRDLGVRFELNTVVGKTVTLAQLEDEYDAVFIGSGAGLPVFLGIPGETYNGVMSANEYLTRVNLMKAYLPDAATPIPRAKRVAVLGAGNVAMDASRTALRLGAEEVTIVYRRTRVEMPARAEEIDHAEQEGVELRLLTQPVEILGAEGRVTGLKCRRCELGEPDASGRRRPVEISGSEFVIAADLVIVAIGTSPNPLLKKSDPRLETAGKGTLVVNENEMTSIDGVYAGGDAVTGAATVILAMGAGKTAAKSIVRRLGAKK